MGVLEHLKGYLTKKNLAEEMATTLTGIRDYYSSYPSTGLTPIKLARYLKEAAEGDVRAYFELAEEMEEKELQYATVLGTRKRTVSQLDTTVIAADDSVVAEKHADFVREFFNREDLSSEYFDMLDAVGKGLSLMEIIWECSESQWMPKKLKYVPPTWLEFDSRDLQRPLLKTADGAVPLPYGKFVYTTIKAKSGLDVRGGLARSVSWAFMFKNYSLKDWVSFLEIYGHPYRVGRYGKNATEADKKKLLKAVYTIGADAAAIIPQDMMIEFIKTEAKSGGDAFQAHAEYFDRAISKAVLGQTTTTDAISGGHAVSKEHNEVRMDIANSDAKQLAKVLNEQLIKPMIDLNFGVQKVYPKIFIGNPETEDVSKLAENLARLLPYGLTVSARQLRSKLGVNAPEDEKDVFGVSYPHTGELMPSFNKSLKAFQTPINTDVCDELAKEELEDWQSLVQPLTDDVLGLADKLIKQGKDLTDFQKELLALHTKPEALAQSLAKASMAARLKGISADE